MNKHGSYHFREYTESSFVDSKPGVRPLYTQTSSAHTRSSSAADGERDMMFWIVVALSQAIGIIFVALIGYWCSLYGGYSVSDPNLLFNYHPALMVLGLIFFYGNAILVYRVFSFLPKFTLKLIHAVLHVAAIVCSSLGLAAVFLNHRWTYKADLYSLHSWVGLGTFGFFCVQFVASFVVFLLPWIPVKVRALMMPFHTFFGVGLFLMAVGSALMGLTEKLLWTSKYTSGNFTTQGVMGNSIGVLLVVFAFLVVFLATYSKYKRKPLPSEIAAPTN